MEGPAVSCMGIEVEILLKKMYENIHIPETQLKNSN